jgi:hypothetical protein
MKNKRLNFYKDESNPFDAVFNKKMQSNFRNRIRFPKFVEKMGHKVDPCGRRSFLMKKSIVISDNRNCANYFVI